MGRARTNQRQALAAGNFNAVLGTRRGSVGAQVQRDADEDVQREDVFRRFLNAVGDMFEPAMVGHSALLLGNKLVNRYRQHAPVSEVADELTEFAQSSEFFARGPIVEDFTSLVVTGDPMLCPGLTEPALLALCAHFSEETKGKRRDKELIEIEISSKNLHAAKVIEILYGDGQETAFYVRTQQLCENIGKMIARPVRGQAAHDVRLGEAAARALLAAPEEVLNGPLRAWIDAFAQRSDQGSLTGIERDILGELILSYKDYKPGNVSTEALAGLVLRGI